MMLTWEIAPHTRFEILAPSWDALNAESSALPFLESHFIAPMLQHFEECTDSYVVIGRENGKAKIAALVKKLGPAQWQCLQPSQLPLGPLLLSPELKIETLAGELLRHLPGFSISLGLTELDPRFVARPADTGTLQTLDYIETAWVELTGDFETYWNARGKNLRQNMRKQRNKLVQEGTKARLECLTDPAEVAEAIAQYGRLESAGWKASGGTAIHPNNPQGRFYQEMMERFCLEGRGRIYRYSFNDKIVAMDLCIESNRQMVILKTAYDESIRTLSPAFLMRQEQFEQLFQEQRIARIEFYGRMMEWHTRWTDVHRTLYHTNVYRWSLIKHMHQWRKKMQTVSGDEAPSDMEGKTSSAETEAAGVETEKEKA